jgi:hypothetical protein
MDIPSRFTGAEDALHAAAAAPFGFTDFGPQQEYLPGLTRLLEALDENGPRFAPGGREFAWNSLIGVLISRGFAERGWQAHPECLGKPLRRPLIITGVPRTGTTALHKLLAEDTQFQGLEKWLTVFPMPRPPRDSWPANPLYQGVVAGLEQFFAEAPAMRAAHNIVADQVDECLEVLKQNFCSNNFGSTWRVPGYDEWWRQQDESSSYQRLKRVLQLIGANTPDQPWLLKNPGHIHHLDRLLEAFPDACVVQTHRDPVKALPSLCSVLAMARGISEGVNVQEAEIGRREFDNWAQATDASMAARERLPGQFFDVRHKDFHDHPMGVVQNIYRHFDFELSPHTEQKMRDRIAADPEGRNSDHRYTLAQFGLEEGEIQQRFAGYCSRYEL